MLSRGSEWRRWDLHVHTPGTILNDQFGTWEEYLKAIEGHSQVKVLGVTDYMCLDSYSRLREYKYKQGRISNIELLIPNLEFRVAPPSEKATAVNLHLLISPDDPDHEQKIRDALARLTWEYDKDRYSCLPSQFVALGKAFDRTIVDDRKALETGVQQFKVDFTAFRDWFGSEYWLRENAIVAVAAGKDGLSGFRRDSAWTALRDEITRFASIIFSGRLGEREFWLGQGSAEDRETVRRLGGAKPCIHGSDAHNLARLFAPADNRYCWIKADTTFEGLRQTLYEPAERVFVGPTPPLSQDEARVIRDVTISNSNGWFEDVIVPLNSGLVSIIGQKGMGKSALAEAIAYSAGSWRDDEASSFLQRAGDYLAGLSISLSWADGRVTRSIFGEGSNENEGVRYLSQHFVERLCAGDSLGADLVQEIESVIFSHIDPTDTLTASNFDELRAIRTEAIHEEGNRIKTLVRDLIREECMLRENVSKLAAKRGRIRSLAEEKVGLLKQLPAPATAEEQKHQRESQETRDALVRVQQETGRAKQKQQKIADIKTRLASFAGQMSRFYVEIEALLKEVGVPVTDHEAFRPQFRNDTEAPLKRRTAELQQIITGLEGASTNPGPGTIRGLTSKLAELQRQETADKVRQNRIKIIQTRIAEITTETERLTAEIANIEGPEKARLVAARAERIAAHTDYFRNLRLEREALEELYAPLDSHLKSGEMSQQEQDLEFSVRWEVDLDGWLERGTVLFDQRRTIPCGTMQGLADVARKILVPAWVSGDPDKVGLATSDFLEAFKNHTAPPSDYLRTGVRYEDLLLWLFEVEHVTLSYGLRYNGIELEKLSPGTKGIVLLILYLGLDFSDTRPLIVDQPDENLDNESIYKLLTRYFRDAKKRRQIILITHNPNLVVNTDSEQVIVAEATRRTDGLPTIRYRSGSLENYLPEDHGIRQQVCRILEGGADAFRMRERRYALDRR